MLIPIKLVHLKLPAFLGVHDRRHDPNNLEPITSYRPTLTNTRTVCYSSTTWNRMLGIGTGCVKVYRNPMHQHLPHLKHHSLRLTPMENLPSHLSTDTRKFRGWRLVHLHPA